MARTPGNGPKPTAATKINANTISGIVLIVLSNSRGRRKSGGLPQLGNRPYRVEQQPAQIIKKPIWTDVFRSQYSQWNSQKHRYKCSANRNIDRFNNRFYNASPLAYFRREHSSGNIYDSVQSLNQRLEAKANAVKAPDNYGYNRDYLKHPFKQQPPI